MNIAESFYRIAKRKYLYNITSIYNIPSIIRDGILSYNSAKKHLHTSIGSEYVQKRRDDVSIPGGLMLHDYANLYFDYKNPMMYKLHNQAENLCVLMISADILDIDGCIVTDRNAATDFVRFYPADEGIYNLDYSLIYSKFWTDDNPYIQKSKKSIKCAEILVPHCIPYRYISGAYVVSEEASNLLRKSQFSKTVYINKKVFYMEEGEHNGN